MPRRPRTPPAPVSAIRTRRLIAFTILLLSAVAVAAALLSAQGPSSHHAAGGVAVVRSADPLPGQSPPARPRAYTAGPAGRQAAAQQLSVGQLAGQRIVYAYAGLTPPASLLAAIRAGQAGGVVFFANNILSPGQIRAVIDELQHASLTSPVHTRLLMLTDQEGGEVRRLPGAPTLSEKQIGEARGASTVARSAGIGAGQNLRGVGINVNLAPVLDVYRSPGDFIDQFRRSYSSDPAKVAALGAAFIGAMQPTGVAATAKHFPGLGSATTSQNTDLRSVTLGSPVSILQSVDEKPYRSAIASGVKLVMTSWAIYPHLDPRLPAGLSSTVIRGELRQRLGFRGVTITDGIDAGAVTRFGSLSSRAVLAAWAGADLILCAATSPSNNTPIEGTTARNALAAAIVRHQLTLAGARQAAARILALRRSLVG